MRFADTVPSWPWIRDGKILIRYVYPGSATLVEEDADLGDGSVSLHESLALAVDEVSALAPAPLRDEAARAVDSSRVELHKLHVLYHRPPTNYHLIFIYKVFIIYFFCLATPRWLKSESPRGGGRGWDFAENQTRDL